MLAQTCQKTSKVMKRFTENGILRIQKERVKKKKSVSSASLLFGRVIKLAEPTIPPVSEAIKWDSTSVMG